MHSQCCVTTTAVYCQNISSLWKKTLYPIINSFLLSPPSSWQLLICFLSLDLPVLDISCKWNHTICSICDWLLSLSIMFLRFICSVTCMRTSFLWKNAPHFGIIFHCMNILHFAFSLISWWTLVLILPLAVMTTECRCEHSWISVWLNTCIQLFWWCT